MTAEPADTSFAMGWRWTQGHHSWGIGLLPAPNMLLKEERQRPSHRIRRLCVRSGRTGTPMMFFLILLLLYSSTTIVVGAHGMANSKGPTIEDEDQHDDGNDAKGGTFSRIRGKRRDSSSNQQGNDTTDNFFTSSFESLWAWNPMYINRTTMDPSSLETLWEDLETKVRSRAQEAEQTVQYVYHRLEEAGRELQEDLSRESAWVQQTLHDLQQRVDVDASQVIIGSIFWETLGGEVIRDELEFLQQKAQQVERDMGAQLEYVKRKVKRELLRQREGWNRLNRSIRNHVGLLVGGLCTFAGGLSPVSRQRAVTLQAGQFTWITTNHFFGNTTWPSFQTNRTQEQRDVLPARTSPATDKHYWIQDTAFVAITALLWKDILPINKPQLERFLPVITVGFAVFRSTRRIIDILKEGGQVDASPLQEITVASVSAVFGVSLLTRLPVPTAVVAASLAGTKLIIDSVLDEIIGNWFAMLERIGPERLNLPRRLYNALCRNFQRRFLYPVRDAFVELEGVFLSSTVSRDSSSRHGSNGSKYSMANLRNKVREAVSRCFRLRLHWTIAGLGVLVQMELLHHGMLLPLLRKGYAFIQELMRN